jgi:hypothetical protein
MDRITESTCRPSCSSRTTFRSGLPSNATFFPERAASINASNIFTSSDMLFAMIVSPFHPCVLSPLISACTVIDHLNFILFTAFQSL